MQPWTMAEVDQWLDWIHDKQKEFDYRYIYLAYLTSQLPGPHSGEIVKTSYPDGGCLLQAGSYDDRGLRLADDDEATRFCEHLRQRYCGDRYPDMAAWETAQHEDFLEEDRWWYRRPD